MALGIGIGISPVLGGGATYISRVLATNPIAYWPLNETAGVVANCLVNPAQNGTYARDVSVMGTGAGIGDGNTAPVFDGANDYINVLTAALIAAFDGAAGAMLIWARVSAAGIWTDGNNRYATVLRADANNQIYQAKPAANNSFAQTYIAGGITEQDVPALATTDWFSTLIAWSKANERVNYYINATPGTEDITLGVWAGNLARAVIGAANETPAFAWSGPLAHCAVWDRELVSAEVTSIANPF